MWRRLFPTVATWVDEWPPEKWMVLPAVIFLFFGAVCGTAMLIFYDHGWYDDQIREAAKHGPIANLQ